MADLRDLYQEVILEHNKNPRNFREIEDADQYADGKNPLCGDALRVYVALDGDTVTDGLFRPSRACGFAHRESRGWRRIGVNFEQILQ